MRLFVVAECVICGDVTDNESEICDACEEELGHNRAMDTGLTVDDLDERDRDIYNEVDQAIRDLLE